MNLLSGDELKEHVNNATVLEKKEENIIQTMIYAIAAFSYLLMCIFSFGSFLFMEEALKNTPAGSIDASAVFVAVKYMLNTVLLSAGIILSAKRKLTPKTVGSLMSMPYFISSFEFLFTFISMMIRKNGSMSFGVWITDLGFAVDTVHCIGRTAIVVLLGYQAYVFEMKKRLAFGK